MIANCSRDDLFSKPRTLLSRKVEKRIQCGSSAYRSSSFEPSQRTMGGCLNTIIIFELVLHSMVPHWYRAGISLERNPSTPIYNWWWEKYLMPEAEIIILKWRASKNSYTVQNHWMLGQKGPNWSPCCWLSSSVGFSEVNIVATTTFYLMCFMLNSKKLKKCLPLSGALIKGISDAAVGHFYYISQENIYNNLLFAPI